MSAGTTLYYPYIHPRSIGNIASALLYWDRVRRIVPPSVREHNHARGDDRAIRVLADRGILVATDPRPYEDKAAQRFFDELGMQTDRFRLDRAAARAIVASARGVHAEKIAAHVLDRLHRENLAHQVGNWVGMREELAAFYMYCLASEMSNQIEAPLFAETEDDAVIGQSLLFEPDAAGDVSHVLASLEVDMPSPEELAAISPDTMVNFLERRAPERRRFRMTLESIVEKVRATADPNAVEDYLADRRTEIREALNETRSVFAELGVGTLVGLMKITAPAGAGALIAAAPIPEVSAAILSGTGVAISAVNLWAETRGKLRTARRTSPYHYLTLIRKELGLPKSRHRTTSAAAGKKKAGSQARK